MQHNLIRRTRASRWPLLPALALALLGAAAQSAPLRVSLDGLDAPDLAADPAGAPEVARYVVAAGARKAPTSDDDELLLVATHALPLQHAAADHTALAAPAATEMGLVAIEAALAAERTLGRFVPPAPPEPAQDDGAIDRVAISTQSAAAVAAVPTPADLEQLREQRMALQWVVVPLVLVAVAVAWFSSRRPTRRRKGERQHERSRRSGRVHRA